MLTINTLTAADSVIIPVQAHYLPAKGLEQLLKTVARVKRQLNPKLEIDGILLTMVDNRSNEMELLRGSIEDSTSGILNHRAETRYSDPKTPIYEKTFAEAREAEELYEWKADHLQSCHCNRMFAQKAEGAHHCNAFQIFLQEWTEKYGLERCMFVLSCSIVQRKGDGRFYPPARQATARFAHYRQRHEGFEISNYTNNVHSGVINLAMENLLKMELAHKHEKPHEPRTQGMER